MPYIVQKRVFFFLLVLFFFACSSRCALAALRFADEPQNKENAYNPHSDKDDILLPMPCGLALSLRVIAVPGGVTNDLAFLMGMKNIEREREIYESSFETHIAASLSAADLPMSWRNKLGVSKPGVYSYYLLGKYEISKLQWDIIMQAIDANGVLDESLCPRTITAQDVKPVTGISWFDVQDFLKRYNAWLITNKLESLPHYEGTSNIGFLRLPTEEEWEFAARGGIMVRKEDRDNNDSFLTNTEQLADYAVFRAEKGPILESVLAIGSRKPNPLKLYDIMGNAREMIDGFFHLTIPEIALNNQQSMRLHGASGGITCKGGSFRSDKTGIYPGWRDEVPLYTKNGAYSAADLGFRVALAGIAVPSSHRLDILQKKVVASKSKNALSKEPVGRGKEKGGKKGVEEGVEERIVEEGVQKKHREKTGTKVNNNVIEELDRILAANDTKTLQANLSQLRSLLVTHEQARERQRIDFLEDTVRSLLYQAETIRSFAFRYIEVRRILEDETRQGRISAEAKKNAQKYLDAYYQALLTCANQYKNHLRKISKAEESVVAGIESQLSLEYSGKGTLDRHMQENLKTFASHRMRVRKFGIDSLSADRICREIIPKKHVEKITHFTEKK